jgi:phosphoribosylformylglycinamidine cyclo-ligase
MSWSTTPAVVQWKFALLFFRLFACGKPRSEVTASIVAGSAEGCRESGCAPLIGGETAEMPGLYKDAITISESAFSGRCRRTW